MSKPLISVISIIHMVGPYFSECLHSLKALTYPNLEIILVVGLKEKKEPDGKVRFYDDGCLKMAEEAATSDRRFRIIRCVAAGVSDARNRGLDAATGEFIGFVDGDDYVEPDMYDRLYDNIVKYKADISVCGKFSEYPGESIKDELKAGPELLTPVDGVKMLMQNNGFFFHSWDKLFKAGLFDGIRFPEDKYLEDRYVIGNLVAESSAIVYDRTPLYHFRVRTDSMSHLKKMSELNSDADMAFSGYAVSKFPELKDTAEAFCIYGHITCIQNALTEGYFVREEEERHFTYVREHRKSAFKNPYVSRNTKVKIFLTLHCLPLLKLITLRGKKRQKDRQGFTVNAKNEEDYVYYTSVTGES
ncbi:MAG: glycosyltransferase [Lachnospiraceae bacterium]|nr:glycosyltransferase [Lachnospiraceae bacterium]